MTGLASCRSWRKSVRQKATIVSLLAVVAFSLNAVDPASAQVSSGTGQTAQLSEDRLDQRKLNAEIAKLESEIDVLRAVDNNTRYYTTWLTAVGSITGATIGSLITLLIWFFGRKNAQLNQDRLVQERNNARELHNLRLFQDLGHESDRARLAAAAVLLDRLKRLHVKRHSPQAEDESQLIANVLVAVLKESEGNALTPPTGATEAENDLKLRKYIADSLVDTLDASFDPEKGPASCVSPLSEFDFQNCCLVNVFWKNIDARKVDFFGSNLSKASFQGAALQEAVFYDANLTDTVLRDANLTGANLMNATLRNADLRNAVLDGALLDGAMLEGARLEGSTLDENKR